VERKQGLSRSGKQESKEAKNINKDGRATKGMSNSVANQKDQSDCQPLLGLDHRLWRSVHLEQKQQVASL